MTAPFWTNGMSTLYHADARDIPLPDQSVHCAVMSPPYWSLRNYDLADGIGLEASLEEWVANILAVMREVHRVLRDDGTLWLNLGDAYVGSGRGMNADDTHSDGPKQATNMGSLNLPIIRSKRVFRGHGSRRWGMGDAAVAGMEAKNLMFQPHRVAMALQKPWLTCRECETTHHETAFGHWPDGRTICPECLGSHGVLVETPGWIVRQTNHWIKDNPMPESARDRSTSAIEYIFHCSKTNRPLRWIHEDGRVSESTPDPDFVWERLRDGRRRETAPRGWSRKNSNGWNRVNRWQSVSYFYDEEAVREYCGDGWHGNKFAARAPERHPGENRRVPLYRQRPGRNLRNNWHIATQGRKDKHHASFPDRLPELCILAGTSEKGVCSKCGNPWIRVVEHQSLRPNRQKPSHTPGGRTKTSSTGWSRQTVATETWRPTCDCGAKVVPATVLDPFVGRGTTCIVAQRLGRGSVGIDLNIEYLNLARCNLESTNMPLPLE